MLRLPAYCQRIFCACFACSCRFGAVAWKWKYFSLKRHMSRHGTTRSGDIVWHWYGARNCCDIINVYVLEIYLCLIRINFNSGKSSVFEDGLIWKIITQIVEWAKRNATCVLLCRACDFHSAHFRSAWLRFVMWNILHGDDINDTHTLIPQLRCTLHSSLWKRSLQMGERKARETVNVWT